MDSSIAIPYMGTKRGLAPAVAEIVCRSKPGVVLDAFSGMCAIGQSIGTRRTVWNNDVQSFAALVATAIFASRHALRLRRSTLSRLRILFERNAHALEQRFRKRLQGEKACLESPTLKSLLEYESGSKYVGSSRGLERERRGLHRAN